MLSKKTKLILLFLGFFLFSPLTTQAAANIGENCTQDSDCITQKCAESDLKQEKNKFCVCDTDKHCEDKYGKSEASEIWKCEKPGSPQSNNLPFCKSDKQGIKIPASTATTPPTGTPTGTTTGSSEEKEILTPPKINVEIPGLPEWQDVEVSPGETVNAPYIAQYVVSIYKYGLVIASLLAVMMIMIGGIMYLSASAIPEKISTAKNIIFGAISGIVLLLGSYIILATINPNLVNLESIQVETIAPVELDLPLDYAEGDPAELGDLKGYSPDDITPWKPKGAAEAGFKGVTNMTYTPVKDKKCLTSNFFGGSLSVGDRVNEYTTSATLFKLNEFPTRSTQSIPILATGKYLSRIEKAIKSAEKGGAGYSATIHKGSLAGWQKVTAELLASTDPEVKGYMQYLYDRAHGKAPNLAGGFEPDVVSTNLGCGAGIKRKQCGQANPGRFDSPFSDPHVLGLAVDVMTISNWDIIVPGSKSSKKVNNQQWCKNYQKTLNKLKAGEYGDFFKSDPYKMYDRIQARITDCLANKYSFWSMPDEWINIFVKNNFYFAGWAWADPKRSDGMHHEFYGNCFQLKGYKVE